MDPNMPERLLTANKDNNGVESRPWEGPRDPGCGAQCVTLFQELKKCETLVLKSLKWVNFSLLEPGSVPLGTMVCESALEECIFKR